MKIVRLGLAAALGLFAAAQFVPSERNAHPVPEGPDALVVLHDAPLPIRHRLELSCNDCHSNRTRYPWYAHIQPVRWFVADHVREGKRAVNFSEFGQLGAATQAKRLDYMIDSVREHAMPLPSYLWLHPDAALPPAEVEMLAAWLAGVRDRLRAGHAAAAVP